MAHNEEALTAHYMELLSRTGEACDWPRIEFLPTNDGHEHVEFNEDGSWDLVVTDRGTEYERKRYGDLHQLMFSLCAIATSQVARRQVDGPGQRLNDLQDRVQERQAELLGRIDPKWARTITRRYAEWRTVRTRMAASDETRERRGRLIMIAVYAGMAALVTASIALVWWAR